MAPVDSELSVVEGSVKWQIGRAAKYIVLESVVAKNVPEGGWVEILCHGRGCPFGRKRVALPSSSAQSHCHRVHCPRVRTAFPGEIRMTGLFHKRRLGVRAHIVFDILKSGWIGKAFSLTVRENTKALTRISCLAPGSEVTPIKC
jgi:hypothetical protein